MVAQWVQVNESLWEDVAQWAEMMKGQQGRYKLLGGVTFCGTVGKKKKNRAIRQREAQWAKANGVEWQKN